MSCRGWKETNLARLCGMEMSNSRRRGGARNYFYVEMSGTTCRIEETVVVGGQHVFHVFCVEQGHPVANEKSRGGWCWHLGGMWHHARSAHFQTHLSVLSQIPKKDRDKMTKHDH
jgi:hypothetical protein